MHSTSNDSSIGMPLESSSDDNSSSDRDRDRDRDHVKPRQKHHTGKMDVQMNSSVGPSFFLPSNSIKNNDNNDNDNDRNNNLHISLPELCAESTTITDVPVHLPAPVPSMTVAPTTTATATNNINLEARVAELEAQLSTLSKLLQPSNNNNGAGGIHLRPISSPRLHSLAVAAPSPSPPPVRMDATYDAPFNNGCSDGSLTPTNRHLNLSPHNLTLAASSPNIPTYIRNNNHHLSIDTNDSNRHPNLESPHPYPTSPHRPYGIHDHDSDHEPHENDALGSRSHHRRLSHIILGTSPNASINKNKGRTFSSQSCATSYPLAMNVLKELPTPSPSPAIDPKNGAELPPSLFNLALLEGKGQGGDTISAAAELNVTPSSLSLAFPGEQHATATPNDAPSKRGDASATAVASESANPNIINNSKETPWLDYLNSYQDTNQDVDRQMEQFVLVPKLVEELLGFGVWICADCFLYVVTILPIRFAWSCCLGIGTILFGNRLAADNPYRFHRRHLYQLISVSIILIIYNYVLMPISIGKLYHWIRGQNMMKLYLLLAMIEVFDRLMCSLGQDCLDSLYWNTTRRPKSLRMFVSFFVVLLYATIHTMILFIHLATLNVAMNSSDQALLSLLIGGNFAEIKSTVFKKYNKQGLFKITASDICERFKLALFLALVLALNTSQGMSQGMVYDFLGMCALTFISEMFSDWIKHAFITKFNFIQARVYPEYALLLAGDVTGIGHEGVNLDHSHAVTKRIGLPQIPLVCVMARYLREAARYLDGTLAGYSLLPLCAVVWIGLVVLKFFSGSFLKKMADEKLQNAPQIVQLASPQPTMGKKKRE